jgi:hypothetical protein
LAFNSPLCSGAKQGKKHRVLYNTAAAAAAATSEVKITTRKRAVIERERERELLLVALTERPLTDKQENKALKRMESLHQP